MEEMVWKEPGKAWNGKPGSPAWKSSPGIARGEQNSMPHPRPHRGSGISQFQGLVRAAGGWPQHQVPETAHSLMAHL